MTREELLTVSNEQLRIDQYHLAVRPLSEEDGGGYLVEFPDIPGCMSDGATPEEAIINGRDALRCVLLTMMDSGSRFRSLAPSCLWRSLRGSTTG